MAGAVTSGAVKVGRFRRLGAWIRRHPVWSALIAIVAALILWVILSPSKPTYEYVAEPATRGEGALAGAGWFAGMRAKKSRRGTGRGAGWRADGCEEGGGARDEKERFFVDGGGWLAGGTLGFERTMLARRAMVSSGSSKLDEDDDEDEGVSTNLNGQPATVIARMKMMKVLPLTTYHVLNYYLE